MKSIIAQGYKNLGMELVHWLVVVACGIAALAGGVVVRDRQLLKIIHDGDEQVKKRMGNVERDYVRRDDLRVHVQSIENMVNQMRNEQRETNRRIDSLLTILSSNGQN